ncbi:MAG: GIY-YIG nuclease family protein [Clostridium sp.]
MNNYIYILRCGDNSLYTGWTNNLEKRFNDHKSGNGAKYTRGRGPLEIVYIEEFEDKSIAMKREYAIKKLSKIQKEDLINKFNRNVLTKFTIRSNME